MQQGNKKLEELLQETGARGIDDLITKLEKEEKLRDLESCDLKGRRLAFTPPPPEFAKMFREHAGIELNEEIRMIEGADLSGLDLRRVDLSKAMIMYG